MVDGIKNNIINQFWESIKTRKSFNRIVIDKKKENKMKVISTKT